jgi:hypothetical protein
VTRELSRAEARRVDLHFEHETETLRVVTRPEPSRQRGTSPSPRPRERRARQTTKTTRGSPSDDPSPEPDGLGLWDDPAGPFTESALGFADQLAQDLASFGDDLVRFTGLLEDARRDLYRQVAVFQASCRDAQKRLLAGRTP